MYQLTKTDRILRVADGAMLPCDPDNSDYARYLSWLDEGNEPAPVGVDKEEQLTTARQWRDSELNRADVQLNKVQDGVKGIGTVDNWRKYRVALRDWPSTDSFPEVRPVAPDAK